MNEIKSTSEIKTVLAQVNMTNARTSLEVMQIDNRQLSDEDVLNLLQRIMATYGITELRFANEK